MSGQIFNEARRAKSSFELLVIVKICSSNAFCSLQKKTKPTYYPKRNPEDSQIDWSNNITEIERFIRAVSKPFNGAFSYLKSNLIIIYSAQVFDYLEFNSSLANPL